MRLIVVSLILAAASSNAAELSLYDSPCDQPLQAETKFAQDGFLAVRQDWRSQVRSRFDAKHLTDSQRHRAEQSYASTVEKAGENFTKPLTAASVFETLNLLPVLAADTCKDPAQLRALSEKAIAGYKASLEALLPMIDTLAEAAGRER